MDNYCTYFDQHYLVRGLALYQSLKQHCAEFQLWVLCMDSVCYQALAKLQLPELHLIALDELERGDADLLRAKANRSLIEYYFTCTPSLPLYIFKHWPELQVITYIDADIFLFADPAPLFRELGDHSVAIVEHRFPRNIRRLEKLGRYNVGWLSFRRDRNGLACLAWWRERCLEWCYDRYEPTRFADQKYLDHWPSLFSGVVILRHKGVNVAPWNITNYRISADSGAVFVDDQPLICFHFHGLKHISERMYDPNLATYKAAATPALLAHVYAPYIQTLRSIAGTASTSNSIRYRGWLASLSRLLRAARGILAREYIFVRDGRLVYLNNQLRFSDLDSL
jgi:hypothetical protein